MKSVETDVKLTDPFDNGADMYRRETIGISGFAINTNRKIFRRCPACVSKWTEKRIHSKHLKFIKTHSKISHPISSGAEFRCLITKSCWRLLQVLKLFEDELFLDVHYDISY